MGVEYLGEKADDGDGMLQGRFIERHISLELFLKLLCIGCASSKKHSDFTLEVDYILFRLFHADDIEI